MAETVRTTDTRKLIYDDVFRAWLRGNPSILRSLMGVFKQLDSMDWQQSQNMRSFATDSATVEVLRFWPLGKNQKYYTLKVSANGNSFFVKVETNEELSYATRKGADEHVSTLRAKEVLKHIPWVEVVEPVLGYQGTGRSYFVSRWRELPTMAAYLFKINADGGPNAEAEYVELTKKVQEIRDAMPLFEDVSIVNMFYDSEAKKIVLYDLSEYSLAEASREKQRRRLSDANR